ncbi:hypothetical protein [Paraburkholderia nodosa]|uniref:hypothetical protein n=1 Tax=Paraburkholderia nodosa TaxID=392320 RepID=UPI0004B2CE4D|nr:hypothetical protein [Paraburkholderia nodosa]
MLRKLYLGGPRLSKGVLRVTAAFIVILYALLYLKASSFLPGFVFRDSEKIQSQIGGSSTYQNTSFDAVAKFYSSLGTAGTDLFVVTVAAILIWTMVSYSKRTGALAINMFLLAPCVFFNLFVASKDTLVVFMALILVLTARRWGAWKVASLAVLLYVGYAVTVRMYFLLILAIAVGAWMFRASSLRGKLLIALVTTIGVIALPDRAYFALLHPRDMAVDYLIAGSAFGARTGFYNLLPPDSVGAFCIDYVYAVAKLHLPVLFHTGPKELAMTCLMGIIVASIFSKISEPQPDSAAALEVLTCLVIGHMAVSMLFEPDLGSYTRHLTSVVVFGALRLNILYRRCSTKRASSLSKLSI